MATEFVEMVHPEVEGVARVPKSAIGQYVRQGWALKPESDPAAPEPAGKGDDTTTSKEK